MPKGAASKIPDCNIEQIRKWVIAGAPNFLSMITFLPFGPNVTFTALASASTPLLSFSLASASKYIFLDIKMIVIFWFDFLKYLVLLSGKMSV